MSVYKYMVNNSISKNGKMSRSEAGKLGALKSKDIMANKLKERIKHYKDNPTFCFQCGEPICYEKRFNKFCSHSCSAKFNNVRKEKKKISCLNCSSVFSPSQKYRKYCSLSCQGKKQAKSTIEEWKNGNNKGYSGKTMQVPPWLRKYLFEKFESKCCKCGWCEINPTTSKIPLEVNHIDGDASNSKEENLELLCPNCHSLTPNFRALNKASKRNRKSA
jgi:hypothetical protein